MSYKLIAYEEYPDMPDGIVRWIDVRDTGAEPGDVLLDEDTEEYHLVY